MPLDLQKLDADIRRLQMIRELASDPEGQKMLERFITPNGNGSGTKAAPAKPATYTIEHTPPPPPVRKYGVMKQYALKVLCSTPQTIQQIIDGMVANGFVPKKPEDAHIAVGEVLRNMAKKGEAKRLSEKGAYGASLWTK